MWRANHWDWPSDDGPGARATGIIGLVSGVAAAVPVTIVYLLVRLL